MALKEIHLSDEDQLAVADIVLAAKERYVDPRSIGSVSLHRNGDSFIATVKAYDDEEEISVELTRDRILKALDWDII